VLIAAFEGWNDAGESASTAVRYLAASWGARRFATIDHEEFYDFTSTRPEVRIDDDLNRRIEWPTLELSAAHLPGPERDVIFLIGPEPQLKWRTFCAAVLGVARALNVQLAVTLGALLTDIPHTRPVRITGSAASASLASELGLQRSRYEGPTGILGVLNDALGRADVETASLWAAVPHYVSQVPSPKAALALVERTAELLEATIAVTDLQIGAAAYERQVTDRVEADEEAVAYVRQLEEAAEDDDDEDETDELEIPSTDALADEVERFLRDHGQG
jgi:proteasome assembly chaperone (PAC2) family protein